MNRLMVLFLLLMLDLLLTSCLRTGSYTGPYTAGSPSVLVKPKIKVWIKPGATEEDERLAGRECGDEKRNIPNLATSTIKERSDIFKACMLRKGFKYYKNR